MSDKRRRVLLVGWDAADWKVISPLVDQGLMPNIARLIETGVMGNMATLQPVLSPMLWTSIATGKRAYKHGIHGFSEPDPKTGGVRPITNLSRQTKAVWNILNQNGKKSHVVGWWPSHPAEPIHGAMVSNHYQQAVGPLDKPWPMRPGTVFPAALSSELEEHRLHPHELDGDLLRFFVPDAPQIDQQKDRRLESLAKIIAECTGIQAAACHLLQTQPDWDFAAIYFDAIDHFSHAFMKYHPPRLEWVSEEDYERYHRVVNGGYCYHDLMLGRLLQLAGPDTTVLLLSDHGFHPDHLRPRSIPNEPAGPAAEHREFGIFVASGPGLKQDSLVFGAKLLDVAPTVLSLFDLPMGRDMDGRVLTTIYEQPPKTQYIDSWEDVPGEDGRHPPDLQMDVVDSAEALKQLVDLGYIDDPGANAVEAVDNTVRELRYNLARACVDGGRLNQAATLFRDLWNRWPRESRFGVHLLQTQIDQELPVEARETLELLKTRKREAAEWATGETAAELKKLREEFPVKPAETAAPAAESPSGGATTSPVENAEVRPAPADAGSTPDIDQGENPEQKEAEIDWQKVPEGRRRQLRRISRVARTNQHALAFLEGSVLTLEGRHGEALKRLEAASSVQLNNRPSLLLKMANIELTQRNWQAASGHFQSVLDLNPLSSAAHLGLARVAAHQRDWERAAREALTAIGQNFYDARAHYIAGSALARTGRIEEAVESLRQAVSIHPLMAAAHRVLAGLLKRTGDVEGARRHLGLARESHRWAVATPAAIVDRPTHAQEIREAFDTAEVLGNNAGAPVALPPLAETVVIVTGLPRSGTSMMMQMLQAGGITPFADDHRPADESNPRGYLEHELARKLAADQTWVGQAKGQAVKIVAQLLPHLPRDHKYRIVMMHRPLAEIVASQKKLLQRLGKEGGQISDESLQKTFAQQVRQVRALLGHFRQKGLLDVLDIKYHDVLRDPQAVARQLAGFMGSQFDVGKAAWAVDPTLRHEKSGEAPSA